MTAEGAHARVLLRWQPGDVVDDAHPATANTKPAGFRLAVVPLSDDGQPIESAAVELAAPSPLISRRSIEPPVYTGSFFVDTDLHTIVVVAGESTRATLFSVASEFTFEISEITGAVQLAKREDRLGEYQGATIATGIPEGQRPLIASVTRADTNLVLDIAPWNPDTARPADPSPTVRARLSPDFKQVIAVEAIPTDPPPTDPPPADPE